MKNKDRLHPLVQQGLTLLDRLTEPDASVAEQTEQRRMRLTASLALLLLPIGIGGLIAQLISNPNYPNVIAILTAIVSLVTAYSLTRTPHAGAALLFLLLPLFTTPLLLAFANHDLIPLIFLSQTVLVASLIASLRTTTLLYLFTIAAVLLYPVRFPATPSGEILNVSFLVAGIGGVALLSAAIRRRDEQQIQQQAADLAASELRFRNTLDQMLEGCQIIGFDWRYRYVNATVAQQGRKTPEELLGRTMMEAYPGIENTPLFVAMERCMKERTPIRMENEFVFPDGSVGYFDLSIQPTREGIFILSIDISARKRVEDEYRRLNEELERRVQARTAELEAEIADRKQAEQALQRWAHIFEHANWGVVIGSADGQRMEMMNPAFAHMHGYTVQELTGKPIAEVFAPEARAELPAQIRLADEQGHHCFESRHVRKDGTTFPVFMDVTAVRDETGKLLYRAANVQDITQRKRAEEEIQKAREEAEAANRAKSEFLSRMSHELRTPLNAILGFAQLLEMSELTPAQAKGVKHIMSGGRHLLQLINEVLDLARIEAGRLALSPEAVELRTVIEETLDLIGPTAAERQVTLHFPDSPFNDRSVLVDQQRLKQVLLNLVNNAVKYNRPGGQVIVECGPPDPASPLQSAIRISVRDTGPGISSENQKRLFEPFDRLGAEQTDIEGTGLGLTVARKLIEVMGGRIGVDSLPGQGSTFWIDLLAIENPRKQSTLLAAWTDSFQADHTKHGTLLYVEDNPSNLELVQAILAYRPGVSLLTATLGRQALSLAGEHPPDLILLDLNLPDMHGSEVLAALKASQATRPIPVIITSADATPGQIRRLIAAGAHDYLTKPLNVHKFLAIVDEVLAAQAASSP